MVTVRRALARLPLVALVAFGVGLVAVALWQYLLYGGSIVGTAVAGLPGGILVVGGTWLWYSDVERDHHPNILLWTLGGAAVLGGVFVAGILLQVSVEGPGQGPTERGTLLSLLFMVGVGGVSGFMTGTETVRRSEQARRAEKAETAANLLSEERTRLEVLNRTSRRLSGETTVGAVVSTLIRQGHVGLPGSFAGVWLYDEATDHLVPETTAAADPGWETSHIWPDTQAMTAFEDGEITTLSEAPGLPDIETLLALPLEGYGLLIVGTNGEFDERERNLIEVYARTAQAALNAVDREQSLREQREFTDALLNSIPDIFFALDDQGRLRRWNDRTIEVSGYTEEELGGMHAMEFIAPEDQAEIAEAMQNIYEEGTVERREAMLVTKTGERIPYELNGQQIEIPDEGVVGIAGTGRDITDRLRRERELERQNERLDSFASTLAHDLRNPLGVIDGRVELARETGDLSHLDPAIDAAERMNRIIDDILELARKGRTVVERRDIDLEAVIKGAWANVDTDDATLEISPDLPAVRGDPDRLGRLFENLFRNALEHGGDGVAVEVGPVDGGIYVADDGPGIPPDRRDRVLQHGYSTTDEGTGFGLAIVTNVAEAHGWSVDVTESESGGARFEFRVGVAPTP